MLWVRVLAWQLQAVCKRYNVWTMSIYACMAYVPGQPGMGGGGVVVGGGGGMSFGL